MEWIQGIQNAIHYIEDNITEELDFEEIAKKAYISSFHFQRGFSYLCGFTLGEYIRNRRLTLAGIEISTGNAKIIDTALKYGYDSPDSFTKAFTRFHGISPSSARKDGASLKSFAPLKIIFKLEGGNVMDYKIKKKESFKVVGIIREFDQCSAYEEIPKFWQECHKESDPKHGLFGICFDDNIPNENCECVECNCDTRGRGCNIFKYMIADVYNGGDVPAGYEVREIPEKTWAVFPIHGAMPKALQDVNTQIWSEWLPNCREYELDGNIDIEMYSDGDINAPNYYSEIWIPIKNK